MAQSSADETIKVLTPIVWVCRWIWKRRTILFGIDILSGTWSGLLLFDVTTTSNALGIRILAWLLADWPFFLMLFIILLLLTLACGLVARLAAPVSTHQLIHQLQHRYLNNVIHDTQMSTLKGIPAGLIAESVYLSDIFIPLQFRHNRPRVDYPISSQDLELYHQELKSGNSSPDLQQVIFNAEKNWYMLKTTDRIGIADVWQLLTTSDAVVIQGYPGTGKSTFMERLTLYLALRLSNCQDTDMPEQDALTPLLLPILLRLNKYAEALQQSTNLTLYDYIMQVRQIVEGIKDERVRKICAQSLQYANPADDQALQELEKGLNSPTPEVQEAVTYAIAQKKR